MASVASDKQSAGSRRRSCDTVCSSNSSCLLHKRKSIHPLANSFKNFTISTRSSTNNVKQRVLSAKLIKLRSLQSQLNDANFHLAELQQENKALKSLQRRQDKALVKYEGENADLPRLLHSHEEQRRVLQEKNRLLRRNLREVQEQLKTREEELLNIRDQIKSLTTLSKNKNLGERQALSEQVEDLKEQLKSSEEQVGLLNRKLTIESKNAKQRLNLEISKHKQTQRELTQALMDIGKLTNMLEGKPSKRPVNIRIHNRQPNKMGLPDRLTASLTRLEAEEIDGDGLTDRTDNPDKIQNFEESKAESKFDDEILKPSYLQTSGSLLKKFEKPKEKTVEQKLEDCCTNILSSVKESNYAVDKHKRELRVAQSEEHRIRECLRETDSIDAQLRNSEFFKKFEELVIPTEDSDIVNEIWKSEFHYQKETKKTEPGKFGILKKRTDENGLSSEKRVGIDEKSKLLAALKAIDEGKDEDFY